MSNGKRDDSGAWHIVRVAGLCSLTVKRCPFPPAQYTHFPSEFSLIALRDVRFIYLFVCFCALNTDLIIIFCNRWSQNKGTFLSGVTVSGCYVTLNVLWMLCVFESDLRRGEIIYSGAEEVRWIKLKVNFKRQTDVRFSVSPQFYSE